MNDRLIKLCPTCGAENAATAQRCACGAFLIGVDVTERPDPTVQAPPIAADAAASLHGTDAPAAVETGEAPPAAPANAALEPSSVRDPGADSATAPVHCPHADCAQPNPPGSATCLYCNRPLAAATPAAATSRPAAVPAVPAPSSADPAVGGGRRMLINLPSALAERLELVEPLKAVGGEADLFIVRDRASGERAVLKLYRHGVEPKTDVLARVSRASPDEIVRLIDFGIAEGVPYELLEYCEHGSLRTLMKSGRPIPAESVRTVLTELVDAIDHLHEHDIVHRDLKPENVLVRGLLPLDLVLTDFGIASVAQATMHYTSAARTLRYSAPETGSNWVGRATDWWSLGMILAEALAGRHPFEGLSEAVIAHQLVTRPVDLSGVSDPRWHTLCRGLLTRDPKARWGAAEIRRWLAGDDVAVADEPAAAAAASSPGMQPYRIGEVECRTTRELAVALARHWATASKDLRRGILRAWVQNDLRDQALARFLGDLEEDPSTDADEKLARLLMHLDPAMPPVFLGYDVSPAGLAVLAARAIAHESDERHLLAALIERRTLRLYPVAELQAVQERFDVARSDVADALARAREAGAPAAIAPQGIEWDLHLFAQAVDPRHESVTKLAALAAQVAAGPAHLVRWFTAIGDPASASPAVVALLARVGPTAREEGIEHLRVAARTGLERLAMTVRGSPHVRAVHHEALKALEADVAATVEQDAALALTERTAALERAVHATLDELWRNEAFVARPVTAAAHLAALRSRISKHALQRAGEAWKDFGERIEILSATGRRSYTVELDTQVEARRTPYKYTAADLARMPELARAALEDPWTCAMPALPALASDFNLAANAEVRCPRCGEAGRVQLQEHSWGTRNFPFATVFACHGKVGIQYQTRSVSSRGEVPPADVPQLVAEVLHEVAAEETSAARTAIAMYPEIGEAALAAMPEGPLRHLCLDFVARARAECGPGQRITAQRLRLRWSGITEVRYRFQGEEWALWVPARSDARVYDPKSPLPLEPQPAPAPQAEAAAAEETPQPEPQPARERAQAHKAPEPPGQPAGAWMRIVGVWLAIVAVIWFVLRLLLRR